MKDSKRTSGVSGTANLRKEDFRLKVGVKSKATSSNALRPKNHLAWYVAYNANPLEKKLSRMRQVKWKCPPKLVLDPGWDVACGEESSEVDTQTYRETTVIEAIYPHLSAIPPSPLISPDIEGKHDDDSQIPLIPIVPIEEAGAIEMPFYTSAPVTTFNCLSTSDNLTLSRLNSSVSPNAPTGEKSLLNVSHGLEGSDLAVAAAIERKHEIDNELSIKILSDPEIMKTLVKETGIGANSELRFPSGPKSAMYSLSSNSTPDPGIDIFVPVAMNQPIPIKESASDLGVTPAKCARICSPNLVTNWNPAPPRSNSHPPLVQDFTKEAREPATARSRTHGTTGTNGPRPPTASALSYNENQYARLTNQYGVPNAVQISPLYPSLSKPNLEAASKPMVNQHPPPFFTGITASISPLYPSFSKPNSEAASMPMVNQHPPPFFTGITAPISPLYPSSLKLNSEAASQPMVNQHPPPLYPSFWKPKLEAASKTMVNQHPPPFFTGTTTPISPLYPSFLKHNSEAVSKPLVNQHPPPLYPSFSKPNSETASKPMVNEHPPPFFTGIKPVFFPPPFSSTSRPYIPCVTDGYRALEHAGLKPCLGSNPSMPFALESNFTSSGTFHSCPYPYMNKLSSPGEDINFCKSLIKQHGEKHIRNEDKYGPPSNNLQELELAQHTNPTFQKPCMFFNSPKGCRKGSNCRYMHVMSSR